MAEQVLDAEKWKLEAYAVIKDIENHVKNVEVSDGCDQLVYLNITTIEGVDYCVELSANGFRIVGRNYNEKHDSNDEYFETPYSLLNKISPQFKCSFGSELIEKLNRLKNNLEENL